MKLSLCMIVKNEAPHLGECLGALRGLVDEIIVVDTGSEDDTKAVAQGLGARVFDFVWCDDFSAARNESLRHANGDYIMWLDADDCLEPADIDKLRKLKTELPAAGNIAYFLLVKSLLPRTGESLCRQMRIFPNVPGIRFENRVHEQILGSLLKAGIRTQDTDIIIKHTGYADANSLARKSTRNLAILQQGLEKDPENPLLHYDVARTLAGIYQHEQAVVHLEKVVSHPVIRDQHHDIWREAGLLMAKYHNSMGQARPAEAMLREVLQRFPEDKLAALYLGESLLLAGQYAAAVETLSPLSGHAWEIGFAPMSPERLSFQVHYFLGRAHQGLEDLPAACSHYLHSLQFQADQGLSFEALGAIYLQEKEYPSAALNLEKAIMAGRDSEKNYLSLGEAYQHINRPEEAEKAFASARMRNAVQASLRAEVQYLEILEKAPENAEALIRLGYLYWERKDCGQALHYLTRAQHVRPGSVETGLALSGVYFLTGDFDQLVQKCSALLRSLGLACARTLESLDDLAALYETIGDHLAESGKQELSLTALQVSFRIYPRPSVLKKIIPLSAALSRIESIQSLIQESLNEHAHDPAVISWMREFTGRS